MYEEIEIEVLGRRVWFRGFGVCKVVGKVIGKGVLLDCS